MPLTLNGNGAISGLGDIDGHDLETNTLVNVSDATFAAQAVGRATLFIDESSNTVGINTTTPAAAVFLEIADATNPIVRLNNTTDGEVQAGCTSTGGYIGTNSDHPFFIRSNSTEKITVLSNGNVGIGNTAPTGLLVVEGDSTGTQTYGIFNTGPAPGDQVLSITSNNTRDHIGLQVRTQAGVVDELQLNVAGGKVRAGIDTISSTQLNLEDRAIFTSDGLGSFVTSSDGIVTVASTQKINLQLTRIDGLVDQQTNGICFNSQYTSANSQRRVAFFGAERANALNGSQIANFVMELCQNEGSNINTTDPANAGNTQFRFRRNSVLQICNSGGGIDFSASQGAGATSSLLSDYEEGSWTPRVLNSSSTTGTEAQSYSSNGRYIKIGNLVWITCQIINLDCKNWTSNTNLFVHDYPFVANANNQTRGAVLMQNVTFADQVDARLLNTRAYSYYDNMVSGATFNQLARDNFAVNSRIEHNFCYYAV